MEVKQNTLQSKLNQNVKQIIPCNTAGCSKSLKVTEFNNVSPLLQNKHENKRDFKEKTNKFDDELPF